MKREEAARKGDSQKGAEWRLLREANLKKRNEKFSWHDCEMNKVREEKL